MTRKDVIETLADGDGKLTLQEFQAAHEPLGELDELTVANIIATGATAQELAEAQAWLSNDEALINTGRPLPTGRVGQLVEIIAAKEQEEEEQ